MVTRLKAELQRLRYIANRCEVRKLASCENAQQPARAAAFPVRVHGPSVTPVQMRAKALDYGALVAALGRNIFALGVSGAGGPGPEVSRTSGGFAQVFGVDFAQHFGLMPQALTSKKRGVAQVLQRVGDGLHCIALRAHTPSTRGSRPPLRCHPPQTTQPIPSNLSPPRPGDRGDGQHRRPQRRHPQPTMGLPA